MWIRTRLAVWPSTVIAASASPIPVRLRGTSKVNLVQSREMSGRSGIHHRHVLSRDLHVNFRRVAHAGCVALHHHPVQCRCRIGAPCSTRHVTASCSCTEGTIPTGSFVVALSTAVRAAPVCLHRHTNGFPWQG